MQMQDVYLGFDTNVTLDRVNGAVGLSPPLTPYPVPPPPFSPAPFLRQRASSAAVKCKCKKFTSHIHIGLSAVSGVCGVRARCLGLVCRVALLLGDVQLVFSCSFALNFRSYDQVATNVVRGAGRRTFGLVLVVIDVVVLMPSLAVPCLSIALRVKLLTCACRQQVLAGWPAARLDFRTAWPGQSHQLRPAAPYHQHG